MANSTVYQNKWKPIVELRRAKPKTYRQAPTHWLKFYHIQAIANSFITVNKFSELLRKVRFTYIFFNLYTKLP